MDDVQAAAARAAALLGDIEAPNSAEADVADAPAVEQEAIENIAAQASPSSQTEAVADADAQQETAEEEPEFELPNFNPKLPADLEEELAEAEYDLDDEPEAEVEDEADENDEDEWDDPRLQKLLRENKKLQKKVAWVEQRKAEAQREKWAEEARKFFPLSDYALANIKATSRRGFLREAKAAHQSLLPVASQIAEQFKAALEQEREKVREAAKSEAASAWGKPTVGPGGAQVPAEAEEAQKAYEAARSRGDLTAMVKARMGL